MPKTEPTAQERKIIDLRKKYKQAEKAHVKSRTRFRGSVVAYLEGGGSPTRLARLLGITRGRIYRYRDDHRKEQGDA